MRMNIQIAHVDRLKSAITGIFNRARTQHLTHDEILSLLDTAVYTDKYRAKLPQVQRARLQGFAEANFDRMYFDAVQWGHMYKGKVYHGWTALMEACQTEEERDAIRAQLSLSDNDPSKVVYGAHFYTGTTQRYT